MSRKWRTGGENRIGGGSASVRRAQDLDPVGPKFQRDASRPGTATTEAPSLPTYPLYPFFFYNPLEFPFVCSRFPREIPCLDNRGNWNGIRYFL